MPTIAHGTSGAGTSSAYPTDFSYGWPEPPLQRSPAADAEKALGAAVLQAGSGEPLPAEVTALVMQGNPARVLIEEGASALTVVVGRRGPRASNDTEGTPPWM